MKVINLFGAPGSGKSTTAAYLFFELKKQNLSVELVTEYAKEILWEDRKNLIKDQIYITAKQNRRLVRLLEHKIDYVITDSPLLLGILYAEEGYLDYTYENLLIKLFNQYENINFLLKRNFPYEEKGRFQNESESNILHYELVEILNFYNIYYKIRHSEKDILKEIINEN